MRKGGFRGSSEKQACCLASSAVREVKGQEKERVQEQDEDMRKQDASNIETKNMQ